MTTNELYRPEIISAPHEFLKALRDHAPAAQMEVGRHGTMTLVSRYRDVWNLMHDQEGFPSSGSMSITGDNGSAIPLESDPPDHARYRKLLNPLFTPKMMADFEPVVRQHARRLIEGFADRGTCEFFSEFAVPYPAELFMQLVGFPMEDLDRMLAWKTAAVRVEELITGTDEAALAAMAKLVDDNFNEVMAYFGELADRRTAEPADDLMTRMLSIEVDGEKLTRQEIQSICFTVMLGGLDTTTAALTCIVTRLARHPEERRLLIAEADRMGTVVEEMMRFESPVMSTFRRCARDTELHGVTIPENGPVCVMLGAANNDEAEFGDPDVIRFDRDASPSLIFGSGPHRCLGMHLARIELRVALEELHRRIPNYRIPEGVDVVFYGNLRTANPLPLEWD